MSKSPILWAYKRSKMQNTVSSLTALLKDNSHFPRISLTVVQRTRFMFPAFARRQLHRRCAAVRWLAWPQASDARQANQLQFETMLRMANGSRRRLLQRRMEALGAHITSFPRMMGRGNGSPSPTGSSFLESQRPRDKYPRKQAMDLSPSVRPVPIWAFLAIAFPRRNAQTERTVPKAESVLPRQKLEWAA
jgi:hypothetical protein